jgi:hypothetical protein
MQVHEIDIDLDALTPEQWRGQVPVLDNFVCPNMALMYRVTSFVLDTRVQGLKSHPNEPWALQMRESLIQEWGTNGGNEKIDRFIDLDIGLLGLPDEYYKLLIQIISAYCCGQYYPAMTSACALGERILNRLILKTRNHFNGHALYKKVWKKESFDNWDVPLEVLKEWDVISNDVAQIFQKLKILRNDSIHYSEGYDFAVNCRNAVILIGDIVTALFNYTNRKDLFWVFDVPGEIWLKTSVQDNPFVKEFVLNHCIHATAYDEPFANPPRKGKNVPLKPITDEEFLKRRRKFQEKDG